jgi:uncharacterized membrane protein YbhN (UPF0104 family)
MRVLALAALVFMARYVLGHWAEVVAYAGALRWQYVLLAAGCTLVMLALMPVGWWLALRRAGAALPPGQAFRIYCRSSIVRYVPGSLWYLPTRSVLSGQAGCATAGVVRSMALEHFVLLAVGGALAGAGLAVRFEAPALLLISLACAAALMSALIWPQWFERMTHREPAHGERPRLNLVAMIVVYAGVWLSYGLSMAALFAGSGGGQARSPGAVLYTVCATAAAWLTGFVSFLPAGLGIRDASLAVLLDHMGPAAYVVVVSIMQRFLEMALEGVLFLAASAPIRGGPTGPE